MTALVCAHTWKLGVEELWASAPAALPTKSDSDMECWLPRCCFSFSLLLLFADFEVPEQCRNTQNIKLGRLYGAQANAEGAPSILRLWVVVLAS